MKYNFKDYIENIQSNLQAGNATEHTHRLALQNLVQSFAGGITATNEPKRVACGAPDYIITKSQTPLGYIEAKDVGKCLNQVERSSQIKRYLGSLNNLIITDYIEFRWYVGGQKRLAAKLANGVTGKSKLRLEPKGAEELSQLLNGFLTVETPTVNNPQELAQRMAKQAQLIKETIYAALLKNDGSNENLKRQLTSFEKYLIPSLTNEQFADMYAQTITYGMFTARINTTTNELTQFSRKIAAYQIPETNPFLRNTFDYIGGLKIDKSIDWIVDDLAEILRRSDIVSILEGFGRKTRTEDPVVYFYENFLAEYDPKLRKSRGVYYTPQPVVSYIVRSVDKVLKTDFGIKQGFLDNPTFRGMRQSLLETFDDIYVLDLHGNSKKKERCPDGSKDENVFDIQQGAAISIFVKRPDSKQKPATVHHAHLWGLREEFTGKGKDKEVVGGKYHWLEEHELSTTEWEKLKPQSPYYLFIPRNTELLSEYEQGWKVTDIMAVNVLGFQTHRDHFAIDFDKKPLYERISFLYENELTDEELREKFDLKKWNIKKARTALRSDENWDAAFTKCLYRSFDKRECYFSNAVMDRPRRELLDNVAGKNNFVLKLPRIVKLQNWQHIFISDVPCTAVSLDVNGSYSFPLYLYPTEKEATLFDTEETPNTPNNRRPNLSDEFIEDFSQKLKLKFLPDGKGDRVKTFAPEDISAYMYAVFHSPIYRKRYGEFLKTDFPRLPLTSNPKLFKQLCDLGDRLIELHLMEKHGEAITSYPIEGNNVVDKVSYDPPQPHPQPLSYEERGEILGEGSNAIKEEKEETLGKVWINKTQYFEGVPQQVWDFYIGGYQVCHKWLKDRKGRTLNYQDLEHYHNIIGAISETIELMNHIDTAVVDNGGFPIK